MFDYYSYNDNNDYDFAMEDYFDYEYERGKYAPSWCDCCNDTYYGHSCNYCITTIKDNENSVSKDTVVNYIYKKKLHKKPLNGTNKPNIKPINTKKNPNKSLDNKNKKNKSKKKYDCSETT